MIPAPLQLRDYWVDSIYVRTNPQYDATKPPILDIQSLEMVAHTEQQAVEIPESEELKKHGTLWVIRLRIAQTIPEGKNIPYEFALEMTGFVAAHPSFHAEQLERIVQVNGPSMLFGAAREILRGATARGPFAPVIIPSANFSQRQPKQEAQALSPEAAKEHTSQTKSSIPEPLPDKRTKMARRKK